MPDSRIANDVAVPGTRHRDEEAEKQLNAILNSSSMSSKLGLRAIVDMYFVLSKDLDKPEMAARVLDHAISKATDELHVELLKSVQKKASEVH